MSQWIIAEVLYSEVAADCADYTTRRYQTHAKSVWALDRFFPLFSRYEMDGRANQEISSKPHCQNRGEAIAPYLFHPGLRGAVASAANLDKT